MSATDHTVPPELTVIVQATATLRAIGALLDEAGIPDGDLLARVQALATERADALDDLAECSEVAGALSRQNHTTGKELDAARAEVAELRLTLAAEQGKAEGAPFSSPPRLRAAVNAERIRRGLSWRRLAAQIGVPSSSFTRWIAGHDLSVPAYLKVCDWLRAAMIAADKATT